MNQPATNMERNIEGLVADPRYLQLTQLKPSFDLFDFLGSLNENASSRALAFLLDSGSDHGLAACFYNALLRHVFREGQENSPRLSLKRLLGLHADTTEVITEWSTDAGRRLDLLVRGYSSDGRLKAVLGIENKHWAAEQEKQVADYQQALCCRFPGDIPRLLLFLAPSLREAKSGADIEGCPWVSCSYTAISDALREVEAQSSGNIRLLISSLITHFDKSLRGNRIMNDEAAKLVHELYRNADHRAAIKHIIANVPSLVAIARPVLDSVHRSLKQLGGPCSAETFEEGFYPKNQVNLKEIKLRPSSLKDITSHHQFTFTYILYPAEGQSSNVVDLGDWVRVQLYARCHKDTGRTHVQRLGLRDKFAKSSPAEPTSSGDWEAIWSAAPYQLQDFGDLDIRNCAGLIVEAIQATLPTLTKIIHDEFGKNPPTSPQ